MANLRRKFAKIYDEYVDKIYRFIFLKVNSQQIAEDLTSEVFMRGWETFKGRTKIENIQAFLYQIARNLIVDHYREKGQAQIISTEYVRQIADPQANLEEKTLLTSDIGEIRETLQNLKDEYREVIVLHYIEEFSISEIAEILEKSEGAVRTTLHRALKALRSKLREV